MAKVGLRINLTPRNDARTYSSPDFHMALGNHGNADSSCRLGLATVLENPAARRRFSATHTAHTAAAKAAAET